LVFSITTLDLLVNVFLHISLENSGSSWLVEPSSLQDMCCIDPVIVSPSHHMFFEVTTKLEFVYRNLKEN
jgi:hypothetical protein